MLRTIARQVRNRFMELRLSPEARAVVRDRLTYLSPPRLARLERTVGRVVEEGVPGDLLEFGVALGGTAILIARHAAGARTFHGFDVFAMIPPPGDRDDARSKARYDEIRSGRSSGIGGDSYYGYRDDLFDDVKNSFARHGRPLSDSIQLHKGLFEESWPTVHLRAVAFAHVDCDWYDPVKYCLEAIGDLVSPGGAIMLDDYHDYGGARTAVDEFLAARHDFMMEDGPNPVLRKIGRRGSE